EEVAGCRTVQDPACFRLGRDWSRCAWCWGSGVEGMWARKVKRLIDVTACLITLPVVLVVCGAVALAIWLTMGRPVLFRQKRAGLYGRVFEIWKFRTMTNERDESGRLLPDEKRLTRLGRFLRSTSLDELPQVWNVLRGEMSLVGPRPLRPEYLERYTPE